MAATILVAGGAGYIGSHACVSLLEAGYRVVVLDNLCVGRHEVLSRLQQITAVAIPFVEGDIRDRDCLDQLFGEYEIDQPIGFLENKSNTIAK